MEDRIPFREQKISHVEGFGTEVDWWKIYAGREWKEWREIWRAQWTIVKKGKDLTVTLWTH